MTPSTGTESVITHGTRVCAKCDQMVRVRDGDEWEQGIDVCDDCAQEQAHEAAILRRGEILRDLGEPVTRQAIRADQEQRAWEARR